VAQRTAARAGVGTGIVRLVLIVIPLLVLAAFAGHYGSSRPSGRERYLAKPTPTAAASRSRQLIVRFQVTAQLKPDHGNVEGSSDWWVDREEYGPHTFDHIDRGEDKPGMLSWHADRYVTSGQQLKLTATLTNDPHDVDNLWCQLWSSEDGVRFSYLRMPVRSINKQTCTIQARMK
jgi:hypothetical protein